MWRMRLERFFVWMWYSRSLVARNIATVFSPLALIYGWRLKARRQQPEFLPVPVVVVGNITVGGTGKTPLVEALARRLVARGKRVGVISRGYGRDDDTIVRVVALTDAAQDVGDEPLLLAHQLADCHVPVAVGRDRVASARRLLATHPDLDVLISDDGLQHQRLPRACEIVVLDAQRGFGNGQLLPAGPLREPLTRLGTVTATSMQTKPDDVLHKLLLSYGATVIVTPFRWAALKRLNSLERHPLMDLTHLPQPTHAVAGVGNPARFFGELRDYDLDVHEHIYPDHFQYQPADFAFADGSIVMTEKDAIKCRDLNLKNAWVVEARLVVPEEFVDLVLSKIHHEPKTA